MRTIEQDASHIEKELAQARELLDSALSCVQSIRTRAAELSKLATADIGQSVQAMHELTREQRKAIEEARAQGQGAGLYKVLDEAAELDREQSDIVNQMKNQPHDGNSKDLLNRFRELEAQQKRLLTSEIGKFKAQGLDQVLDRFLALSEQQDTILRELIARL